MKGTTPLDKYLSAREEHPLHLWRMMIVVAMTKLEKRQRMKMFAKAIAQSLCNSEELTEEGIDR